MQMASDFCVPDGASNFGEDLEIMHLQKLFADFTKARNSLTEDEQELRLYQMLPLFCKAHESLGSKDLPEKFPDILSFGQYVSKLMVTEIKRRGSNQSTETASKNIINFLGNNASEENRSGWILLTAVNHLASGNKQLIKIMTLASIPSTLVKCLYLFFDLPEPIEVDDIKQSYDNERYILLQKMFVQVLVRLCSHPYPAEELARMDDLSLLFSAVTSQCSSYNMIWRKSAAEVLTTLSRHGLTNPVVNYLHVKGCVSLCIDNMQRSTKLQPLEVVEMIVSVFCFLKDSSEVSQVLLDDFKSCQGYLFLVDFLLKLDQEEEKSPDIEASIRNLVLMTASLCLCGFSELKVVMNNNSLYQMQGFKMPQISSRGSCVRNLHAFQVLQTVFLKSNNPALCCIILDAISSVYHSDNANYFILESQNTLCQFSDIIHLKGATVREKFFGLLEFIVFQLNFVPCKELISLSLLLKSNYSIDCSILCMKTLLNLLKFNSLFCDVYREVGILEVFVNCLKKYRSILEINQPDNTMENARERDIILGNMILEAFTLLLNGNNNNAIVFRDSGGSKCIHDMVQFKCRPTVLKIIKEMMVNTGGDDDMLRLVECMHNAPMEQIQLKIHILKSLVACLRDSHRTRTIFRKVNGFTYLIQTLEDAKNCFIDVADYDMLKKYVSLLRNICEVLATSMRFEPANAKFFQHQLCCSSFYNALKNLGCFSTTNVLKQSYFLKSNEGHSITPMLCAILARDPVTLSYPLPEPKLLSCICIVYRIMYSIALDNFDSSISTNTMNNQFVNKQFDVSDTVGAETHSKHTSSDVLAQNVEPVIVHPGIVICMLLLLPSVEHGLHIEHGLLLQCYLAELIKSLVRSERNQQIMCEVGMPGTLLKICRSALLEEKHILHLPLQYIFERLAVQAMHPKEFREFLRLGFYNNDESTPETCPSFPATFIPLTRIKTLVSMTTPRDFRAHGSYTLPPFVEMDMNSEGFGCIFLPSIAPQSCGTNVDMERQAIGGIGTGHRSFPSSCGLSYSTWFCVDKFCDSHIDSHCVRLLTIVRTINKPKEEHFICLSVLLSAKDKSIIASTQEILLEQNTAEWEPEYVENYCSRVWCPDLLIEGQWHHLVVVLNKTTNKNASFSLYIDGHHMQTQRIQYIAACPANFHNSDANVDYPVYAYIGTPPLWRRYSKLCWKQGVCHMVEDVFNQTIVSKIFALGPHYIGSLQAPHSDTLSDDTINPIIPEERLLFGLNARAVSSLTLSKIRKVYSRIDCKAIAKQLGMNSHENATPIKILHNSAGHLAGPSRTLGGVLIGYLGIRCFSPNPVSAIIYTVGGCSVLLGIIGMSQNIEGLYAGVKALTCVIKSNISIQNEMDRKRYYQTLGMIFKRKKHLLNSHILHLTFNLVGTVNSGHESSAIPNVMCFQDLMCDFDIWLGAPNDLLKSLLEHLLELSSESNEKRTNVRIMRDMQCVSKLLNLVEEVHDHSTREVIYTLLEILIGPQPRVNDLLLFGQSLVYNIPQPTDRNERDIKPKDCLSNMITDCYDSELFKTNVSIRQIIVRNRGLRLLHTLLFTTKNTVNVTLVDEISKVLGMDWIMLFMQPHLNSSTIVWAMRILVVQCANDIIINRFREGNMNGGYLKNTEAVSNHKDVLHLSSQTKHEHSLDFPGATVSKQNDDAKQQILHTSGFSYLEWLLQHHICIPELYFLLTALMLGQPVKMLGTEHINVDLDRIWSFLWGSPVCSSFGGMTTPKMSICTEAVCILLNIIRKIVNTSNDVEWLENHPITLVQVLFSLYHNLPDFMSVMMSAEVTTSLVGVVIPLQCDKDESGTNSTSSTSEEFSPYHKVITCTKDHSGLTGHPVKKIVIEFIRVIVVDSLSLASSGKGPTVVDNILDACPEKYSMGAKRAFLTEITTTLMDHMLAADILGEQAALPIVPLLQSHVQHIAPNVFYLTARIVDKLWQEQLWKNPHEIFEFIIKLIIQAKKRSAALTLDHLYHSLNRCILYLLSRPTETVADQMTVMEALHKLTTNRLMIFGAGNHELEFIGCLTFCLMQLIAKERITIDMEESHNNDRTTTWHISPIHNTEELAEGSLNHHQGTNLIANAATRVWEELYVCKKPAIEEVFKVTLVAPINNAKAPNTSTTREQILDSATKLWCGYISAEKKAQFRVPWELHNHIQSKIQKVTGNLTRLASRTKVKRDDINKGKINENMETIYELNVMNLYLLKEFWDQRSAQLGHIVAHTQRYVYQEWLHSEAELFRERGLWGPTESFPFTKWMLDTTEGPHRMRKKMMKNELFYEHYPYRPELEMSDQRQIKYKVATSFDSKKYFASVTNFPKLLSTHLEAGSNSKPAIATTTDLSCSTNLDNRIHDNEQGDDIEDDEEELSSIPDNQTLIRLLEDKEKISHIFRCARIQGLDTFEGLFLFGIDYCYVIDGFTLLKNREIRDIESLLPGSYEPILPNPSNSRVFNDSKQSSKFAYEDIREVHKRRYLLQPIALEIFTGDGQNFLLSFPRKVRNKVYQKIISVATAIADNAQQSVAGQSRSANVEQSSNIFSSLIGETSVTQRWIRGEISNFQYLMHLNTLAGRSYNDLMQYPVFPWILADYESEKLDLNNPSTFRDFSKPMGAQSIERLKQFEKRYKEWDDPHGETPPYFYGTHYSSAMIVCSYLVRLEPFTQHFLRLQGGHFDLADRMFHSIKEAWHSASKHNMADVKELIPEFFYLPEFLINANNFDLGMKQNGDVLNNVVLPPWAKDDPREFIRMHREALESSYVSQNLHLWIDLIFGYKQRGHAASQATNVFHHLFYEGNVDIYNIDDPLKKNATIGFINNFGQIPKQLFRKAHPAKRDTFGKVSVLDTSSIVSSSTSNCGNDKLFFYNLENLKPSLQPIKEVKGPVGHIVQVEKLILAVEQNKMLLPPNYNRYLAWGYADHSIRVGIYDTDRALFVCETAAPDSGEILACACPNAKTVIMAGTSSILIVCDIDFKYKQLKVKHTLHGHTDAVTSIAASTAYNIIVSGSKDRTAIIWDMSRYKYVRQLQRHVGVVAAICINELSGDIATCSDTWLYVWSINGQCIAKVNTSIGCADQMQQILCVTFSTKDEWDTDNVIITGSTDGVVRMWSMDHVQIPTEHQSYNHSQFLKEENNSQGGQSSHHRHEQIVKSSSVGNILELHTSGKCSNPRTQYSTEKDDHRYSTFDVRSSMEGLSIDQNLNSCESTQRQETAEIKKGKKLSWHRQLIFRSKLTMHTAYDRKDNDEPASITSIAISHDHRTVFVGDARGRIYSWSVADQPGRIISDNRSKNITTANQCVGCRTRFGRYERRSTCRNCGYEYCSRCYQPDSAIFQMKIRTTVQKCKACCLHMKEKTSDA